MNEKLLNFLDKEMILYEVNVDLKTKTLIKRGGIVQIWLQPTRLEIFEKIVIYCQLNKINFHVFGNTSNCYFLDDFNTNIIISTLKLNQIRIDKEKIICDCGFNMSRLAKYCASNGFAGYEGFYGLPGTAAGAAVNNSGCYGSLTANVLEYICLFRDGKKEIITNNQMNYSKRNSVIKSKELNGVITEVVFKVSDKLDKTVLKERIRLILKHRQTHQELKFPSLGSVFSGYKISFPIRLIGFLIQKSTTMFMRNDIVGLKLKTKFLLSILNAGSFKKYVSDYSMNSFLWKDKDADSAFVEYVEFMRKKTNCLKIEISIFGDDKHLNQ